MLVDINRKYLFGVITIIAVCQTSFVDSYDANQACALVQNGTLIGDPLSCVDYYSCTNGAAVQQRCKKDLFFDKNLGECVTKNEVNCSDDTNPCRDKKNQFAANPFSCTSYYWCNEKGEHDGDKCVNNLTFNEKGQSCGYSTCEQKVVENPCDRIFPDNIRFGSSQHCDLYLQCNNGTLSAYTCKIGELYDVATANCIASSQVNCTQLTGDTSMSFSTVCVTGTQTYCPDHCMYFKVCNGTAYIIVMTNICPMGELYDAIDLVCKPRLDARTYPLCDRCETTTLPLVVNVGKTCNTFSLCNNGTQTAQATCNQGLFFNEYEGNCVPVDPNYEACTNN